MVLAPFGKSRSRVWWPAIVQDVLLETELVELYTFGDHRLTRFHKAKLRPYDERECLMRGRNCRSSLYDHACDEATRWLASHPAASNGAASSRAASSPSVSRRCERDSEDLESLPSFLTLPLDGLVVPAHMLPPVLNTYPAELPKATFRLVGERDHESDDDQEDEGPTAANATPSVASTEEGAVTVRLRLHGVRTCEPTAESASAGGVDDATDDASLGRRHAPFERLERRGFAAQARLKPRASPNVSSWAPGPISPRKSPRLGDIVVVPATVWGSTQVGEVVSLASEGGVDLYFEQDDTVCWFPARIVACWPVDIGTAENEIENVEPAHAAQRHADPAADRERVEPLRAPSQKRKRPVGTEVAAEGGRLTRLREQPAVAPPVA